VLVRVRAAGLCHTDLEVIDGSLRYPTPIVLGARMLFIALISRWLRERRTDRERPLQRCIVRKPLRSELLILALDCKAFAQCLPHRPQGREGWPDRR